MRRKKRRGRKAGKRGENAWMARATSSASERGTGRNSRKREGGEVKELDGEPRKKVRRSESEGEGERSTRMTK